LILSKSNKMLFTRLKLHQQIIIHLKVVNMDPLLI